MKNRIKSYFYFWIYLLILLTIVEISLRGFFHYYQAYDIEMWKYGNTLKKKASDPKISHQHNPNSSALLYRVEISINSKGLRDREFNYVKSPEVKRVLFLGDSLTLGWGVPFDQIFTKLLERKFSQLSGTSTEVLNTGVGNYNSEQEYTYYRNEGFKYNPDHIMLLYFINDAEPTPIFSDPILIDKSLTIVFVWSRIKKILAKLDPNRNFLDYYSRLYKNGSQGWEVSKASILSIKRLADKNNSKFTVAICPELRVFNERYPFKKIHKKILSFLKGSSIDFIDLLPVFKTNIKNEKDVWVSIEDSHPNILGHKIIAQAISHYFAKYPEKL